MKRECHSVRGFGVVVCTTLVYIVYLVTGLPRHGKSIVQLLLHIADAYLTSRTSCRCMRSRSSRVGRSWTSFQPLPPAPRLHQDGRGGFTRNTPLLQAKNVTVRKSRQFSVVPPRAWERNRRVGGTGAGSERERERVRERGGGGGERERERRRRRNGGRARETTRAPVILSLMYSEEW